MTKALRTYINAFDVQQGGASVHVAIDPDLGIKFDRGEVLRGDTGSIAVAMVMGIDEGMCTRIDVSGSSIGLKSILEEIRDAVDIALEGCPQ